MLRHFLGLSHPLLATSPQQVLSNLLPELRKGWTSMWIEAQEAYYFSLVMLDCRQGAACPVEKLCGKSR